MKKRKDFPGLFLVLLVFLAGCSGTRLIRSFTMPEMVNNPTKNNQYIKIHLKDGGLYVLDDWKITQSSDTIIGEGEFYNFKREHIGNSSVILEKNYRFSIPANEIALVESNRIQNHAGHLAALSIVGVPTALFSIYCIANPKACFGSCPTFYVREKGQWSMMAEGFSSSISPSFEKRDIDMLYWADDPGEEMSVKLTNEALETHVIRYVDLLAFPESGGKSVFSTQNGQFYSTSYIVAPISCQAEEGDCQDLVKEMDRKERFGGADPKNLSQKEEIIVRFDKLGQSERGLLIGSRQTLMTTHLFYQVMAYTGNYYGSFVSEVANGNTQLKNRIQKLWDELGGIEIFMENEKQKWEKIGEITEMGPIASDVHLVKLPATDQNKINIKLRLTKGLWRIDYLALANISGEEIPVRLKPYEVLRDDFVDHKALILLNEENEPLVTMPGDRYELKYKIPADCQFQYFLETKGYYLEWMREEWLAEENLKKAAFALYFPGLFMRKAAPEYKKAEPLMEKIFWESRYVRQ